MFVYPNHSKVRRLHSWTLRFIIGGFFLAGIFALLGGDVRAASRVIYYQGGAYLPHQNLYTSESPPSRRCTEEYCPGFCQCSVTLGAQILAVPNATRWYGTSEGGVEVLLASGITSDLTNKDIARDDVVLFADTVNRSCGMSIRRTEATVVDGESVWDELGREEVNVPPGFTTNLDGGQQLQISCAFEASESLSRQDASGYDCAQHSNANKNECGQRSGGRCFWWDNECLNKLNTRVCPDLPKELCGEYPAGRGIYPGSQICAWLQDQCVAPVVAEQIASHQRPGGYKGPLPDCAFSGTCRDINKVFEVLIGYANFVFGMIGSFALVMFIYGGFMIVFSMGNAERVKKGRDILVAAVIGIVIVFSAYLLVDFLLDALNVSRQFRAIN